MRKVIPVFCALALGGAIAAAVYTRPAPAARAYHHSGIAGFLDRRQSLAETEGFGAVPATADWVTAWSTGMFSGEHREPGRAGISIVRENHNIFFIGRLQFELFFELTNPDALVGRYFYPTITAGGELSGEVSQYDTPPILFEITGGERRVRASTTGLPKCLAHRRDCESHAFHRTPPVEVAGTWYDTWTGPPGVTCETSATDPTAARCSVAFSAPTGTGALRIKRSSPASSWLWGTYPERQPTPGEIDLVYARAIVVRAPDLTVHDIRSDPELPVAETPVRFTARIQNTGDAPAATSQTQFALDLDSADGTPFVADQTLTHHPATDVLEPGASVTATSGVWSAQPGTHRVRVRADILNVVRESNPTATGEDNNEGIQPFTVARIPLPPPPPPPPPTPLRTVSCEPFTQTVTLGAGGRATATITAENGNGQGNYAWTVEGGALLSDQGNSPATVEYRSPGQYLVRVESGGALAECAVRIPAPHLTPGRFQEGRP